MKSVMMITRSEFPYDPRVDKESRSLVKNGFKVFVFSIRKTKNLKKYQTTNRIKIQRVKNFNSPYLFWINQIGFIFLAFLKTLKVAINREFDIIHFHNPPDILIICSIIPKIFKIKIVFDFHDPLPEFFEARLNGSRFFKAINLFIEKIAVKLSDKIIVTNETTKKIFIKRNKISASKIFVVRYGMDSKDRSIAKSAKKKKSHFLKLVFLGHIGKQDNVLFLIDIALHLVKNLKKPFKILVVGSGSRFFQLKQLININRLQENFILFGKLSNRNKVFDVLKNSDIALEPANLNPLNKIVTFVKLIEYRFFNLPTVCFKTYESQFTMKESALYSTSVAGFHKNVLKLSRSPKLMKKMVEESQKNIKTTYWEKSEKILFDLYEKLNTNNN